MNALDRKFEIELHGVFFDIPVDGIDENVTDFMVSVFVEAKDEDDACNLAMTEFIESTVYQTQLLPFEKENSVIEVSQWYELSSFDDCPTPISPVDLVSSALIQ